MIKFVIGLIALIFVALAVYTYTDKKAEVVTKSAVTHNVVKEDVTEAKVEKPTEVMKELNTSVKKSTEEIDLFVKDISYDENQVTNLANEIGKGLTIEGIENTDVSNEEKEVLFADMAYRESLNASKIKAMTEEEALRLIEQDVKNGILK